MKKLNFSFPFFLMFLLLLLSHAAFGAPPLYISTTPHTSPYNLDFLPSDRILVMAPHPDDEVLGCGGIIQQAVKKNIPVRIVFLTYGDANEWSFIRYRKRPVLSPKAVKDMGRVRRKEAIAAGAVLGVPEKNLIFLGYPDLGTLGIWLSRWGNRPAYQSILTRTREVPYKSAYNTGAPYKGESIVKDIKNILKGYRPTRIFVSHPADHHPDHIAFYLFTKVALWELGDEINAEVYPYLVHTKRWPLPRGLHNELSLKPPRSSGNEIVWIASPLTPEEENIKEKALLKHATQVKDSPNYLFSFIRKNELFGDYPSLEMVEPKSSVRILPGEMAEYREDLTDAEKDVVVDLKDELITLKDGSLEIIVNISRPISEKVGLSFYLFGYRPDIPFSEMPKIRIKLGVLGYGVYDRDKQLPKKSITITRENNRLVMQVPLSLLKNPWRIFVSSRTYISKINLGWAPWRVLKMPVEVNADKADRPGKTD
ncbi:MAG: PIG-L family deacetylase [Chloroflexi bacterium]|nr:PIG-L family deacetylase [Chloroflexota bacterium]